MSTDEDLQEIEEREITELLMMAGKAAGHTLTHSNNSGGLSLGIPYTKSDIEWNPLWSAKQAFELAIQLEMSVSTSEGRSSASIPIMRHWSYVEHGDDPLAATLKAIVLCAADIGKSMP